jgi:hypothetical protein
MDEDTCHHSWEFDGDDPYDGVRYLVDAADNYFVEAVEEFRECFSFQRAHSQ